MTLLDLQGHSSYFLSENKCSLISRSKKALHIMSATGVALLCYAPARREGDNKRCFCPSVRPSVVAYIANNSRTQRPSAPKLGIRFSTLDATIAHQFQSQKLKKSGSPGPLLLTHIVHHIFRMAKPTNFKLGIRMEDDDPHQPQAPCSPMSKIKVTKSRDQSEPCWPNGP